MCKRVVAIVLGCLAVYLVKGQPPGGDCVPAPYTAWALVRTGSVDLREYTDLEPYAGTYVQELPDGRRVSIYPPGAVMAAVPVVLPFALLRAEPLEHKAMLRLGKVAAALCVAAAAGLFFVVCRRLAPDGAWPATVLFALGTCLWSGASQGLWMHGPATLWLCCALYCLTRPDGNRLAWSAAAGLALGLAVLTRPSTAFFLLATGGVLLTQRRWRDALVLAAGAAVPVALLCWYNASCFDQPVLGGYPAPCIGKSSQWWLGFPGLLIAPSRGLLVYTPGLLLVPVGVVALFGRGQAPWGQSRRLILFWLLASAVTWVFYARFHGWHGGWSYGPRFLTETMPALCLLFAIGYSRLTAGWRRRFAVGLVALSVAIHAAGIFGASGSSGWHERHPFSDGGRSMFSLRDTQIEAHGRAILRKLKIPGG